MVHRFQLNHMIAKDSGMTLDEVSRLNLFDKLSLAGWKYVEKKENPGQIPDVNSFISRLRGKIR